VADTQACLKNVEEDGGEYGISRLDCDIGDARRAWSLPRRELGDGAIDVVNGEARAGEGLMERFVRVGGREVGFGGGELLVQPLHFDGRGAIKM
jgi:hypothetical protein